jgi:predicted nucleic acid-binding protein
MSGIDVILDTNAIVPSLRNKETLTGRGNTFYKAGISVISIIEFLSNKELEAKDKYLFEQLLDEIEVINVETDNQQFIDTIISIRKKYKIKFPDAIIAATAIINSATLYSADEGFSKIHNLKFKLIK